jgi:enoyl-CoA hydratase
MAYEHLLYAKKDRVATITLNRPAVLNALNGRMLGELEAVLAEAAADAEVGALIFIGAGEKAFVAGADIQELSGHTPASGREASLYGQSVFGRLETMGKPSIAAINGFALGGGCELALACTVRLASRTARMGQPEVKLGLMPGYGGTQRLARLCGAGVAQELLPAAEALARKFVSNAPVAVRLTMEAIRRGAQIPLEEGLALEATLFAMCCGTADMAEGTRAFLEKRPARFQGR